MKKVLGGDPEAIQAGAVLTKYKGQLSAAVADAAVRATKRYDAALDSARRNGYMEVVSFVGVG